jgi:hypothetical protein
VKPLHAASSAAIAMIARAHDRTGPATAPTLMPSRGARTSRVKRRLSGHECGIANDRNWPKAVFRLRTKVGCGGLLHLRKLPFDYAAPGIPLLPEADICRFVPRPAQSRIDTCVRTQNDYCASGTVAVMIRRSLLFRHSSRLTFTSDYRVR